MKGFWRYLSIALLASVCLCTDVWAQGTAEISGRVTDATGALLPGVEISTTQTDTGVSRIVVTNETGSYILPNLPLGPHQLTATLPGFQTFVQSGIVLQVGSSPAINIALEVGQVAQTIEVQANAAMVETRALGISQVIENERILELPLNGRAVNELVALFGAATTAPTLDGNRGRAPFTKSNVSVAGGLHTGVQYTLDGAYHQNPYTQGYMTLPFPDALQEFKVETGATGAAKGGKSGGSVTLVTQSGTNEYHGNLFEFVRNGKFNARNFFATKRDSIKRNQFGGTIGGPVVQNRLFFFGGYQGTTLRQDPSDTLGFVPTAAMMAGDFRALSSAACNRGREITLRAPFVDNQIDPALFSPPAVNLANKLPSSTDPCGRLIYGAPRPEDGHQFITRVDYQLSDNHSVFGRYLYDFLDRPSPYNIDGNVMNALEPSVFGRAHSVTVGSTTLFGSNIVHAIRLHSSRLLAGKFPAENADAALGPEDIGVNANVFIAHNPTYSISGGLGPSGLAPDGSNSTGPTKVAVFSLNDDLSIVTGSHQLAMGVQAAYWQGNSYSTAGTFSLRFRNRRTGLGWGDFFTGQVDRVSGGTGSQQHKIGQFFATYFGDTWQATPRLTVNYGVRWEPFLPLKNKDLAAAQFQEDWLEAGLQTVRFSDAPPGVLFHDDPQFTGGQAGMDKKWANFSPRLGFAFDVNGDGRTSIRVSAGSSYDYPHTGFLSGLTTSGPFNPSLRVSRVDFVNPWATRPGGDPFPRAGGPYIAVDTPWPQYSNFIDVDPNTANTQVYRWNLSVQHQLGTDWLVSASYLGSNTIHVYTNQAQNRPVFFPGNSDANGNCQAEGFVFAAGGPDRTCSTSSNTDDRRRLQLKYPEPGVGDKFGNLGKIDTGGTASYNGMLLSVQRRATGGVTLNVNYTWSHCISDPWLFNIHSSHGGGGLIQPNNRAYDRGNCVDTGDDRRHLFNTSVVMASPEFSNPTARALASGWQFSSIIRVLSGAFMSVETDTDPSLTDSEPQRVNLILDNPFGDKTAGNYLNPAAFERPAAGTFGNLGRSNIRGPGTWQFDVSLSRSFQLTEAQRIELRAEAFNILNGTRFRNPQNDFDSNTFGQVTRAEDPRIMQFALKYYF